MGGRVQRPHKAYPQELAQFHSEDYLDFLHRITPNTKEQCLKEMLRCNPTLPRHSPQLGTGH